MRHPADPSPQLYGLMTLLGLCMVFATIMQASMSMDMREYELQRKKRVSLLVNNIRALSLQE